jgi:hypothetical protein
MLSNVRGFSTRFHDASSDVTQGDPTRTRVAAPSLKAADIEMRVRATCLLAQACRAGGTVVIRMLWRREGKAEETANCGYPLNPSAGKEKQISGMR